MSELTPGTYSVGIPQSSPLSQEERKAIQLLSTSFVTQVLTFHWLYHQGSMLHSITVEEKRAKGTAQFAAILMVLLSTVV